MSVSFLADMLREREALAGLFREADAEFARLQKEAERRARAEGAAPSMGDEEELPRLERLAREMGTLLTEKNAAYGDSFSLSGEVMALLYPNGLRVEQYRDALAVVRVLDKLFRVATRKDAFGESPWRDIAGYGMLAAAADEADKERSIQRKKMESSL